MKPSNNIQDDELASIRQELNELRSAVGAMRKNDAGNYHGNGTSFVEAAESSALTDRRGMMKKMAGIAVGVATVGLLKPSLANAGTKNVPEATGGNLIIGAFNSPTAAGDRTALINPGSVLFPLLFLVDDYASGGFITPASSIISIAGHVNDASATPTGQNLYGVYGQAQATSGSAFGVYGLAGTTAAPSGDGVTGVGSRGVVGLGSLGGCGVDGSVNSTSTSAYGVYGTASSGVGGTFGGGRAALFLVQGSGAVANPNTTNPSGGSEGDVYRGSTNGSLWYRTSAATNPYRRLADAGTAGALTLLASPVRYVDTRFGTGDPNGAYSNGTVRQYNFVSLQAGTIPAGARGIVANIVAVSPGSTGNLAINTINSFPPVSVLNFNTNQDIANHFVSALDASGNLFVKSTINGGTVHVIVDIYGYYL